MTFWLTRKPPYVIRLLFVGPKGAKWSWDMI